MGAKTATAAGGADRSIDPNRVYPLPTFMALSGWGRHAMRSARRNGLAVRYVGGRAFVLGADFAAYLARQ